MPQDNRTKNELNFELGDHIAVLLWIGLWVGNEKVLVLGRRVYDLIGNDLDCL